MPNLIQVSEGLTDISLQVFEILKRNWSSVVQVYDKTSEETWNLIRSGNKELFFEVRRKDILSLDSKQRVDLVLLLIFMKDLATEIEAPVELLGTWDIYLKEKLSPFIYNSEIISVLSELEDKRRQLSFIYNYLGQLRHWQTFLNSIKSHNIKKEGTRLSLLEYLERGYCLPTIIVKSTPRPKKPQFHKGYRDHGSLGSDLSRITKEERDDVFLQDNLRKEVMRRRTQLLEKYNLWRFI